MNRSQFGEHPNGMPTKVSIITVVYNNSQTLNDCIQSVLSQTYPAIEYIVIDGGSTDGTVDIIRSHESNIAQWISEHDSGIYDAMNKGISMATGDIVGILNSDDFYAHNQVIQHVVDTIANEKKDSCYGDIVYVDRTNVRKVIRHWRSGVYRRERFKAGWMPPHPAFFCKRSVYQQYGLMDLSFPLAADYELMLRLMYRHNISASYIPEVLVRMRTGGTSNPGTYTLKAIYENYRAWKVNGLRPNPLTFIMKPLSKLRQFFQRDNVG